MSNQDEATRRALSALRPAADEASDAHPGSEVLEAYVEGRLTAGGRAHIDDLAARSSMVAEDLADLQAVHDSLAASPVGRRNIQWGRIAVAAGIAASLLAGVWLTSRQTPAPEDQPQLAVSRLTADEKTRVDAAVAAGRVVLPEPVAALIRPELTLLGAPAPLSKFGLLTPIGTAVRSARPSLTWSDGLADAYTVGIFDEGFVEVARSPRVTGTSWTPDADLPRGATYLWQVTAHRGPRSETEPKPPQPEARFSVIDANTLARVEEFGGRLAGDPLSLGILLADAGLIDDARGELTRAAADPGTAEIARRLLTSLDQPSTAK